MNRGSQQEEQGEGEGGCIQNKSPLGARAAVCE